MGVVLWLGSLAWVVLRSTAACQEGRPTRRSAKKRGGSVAIFSGRRGGNPIAANSSTVLSETKKRLPKPSEPEITEITETTETTEMAHMALATSAAVLCIPRGGRGGVIQAGGNPHSHHKTIL